MNQNIYLIVNDRTVNLTGSLTGDIVIGSNLPKCDILAGLGSQIENHHLCNIKLTKSSEVLTKSAEFSIHSAKRLGGDRWGRLGRAAQVATTKISTILSRADSLGHSGCINSSPVERPVSAGSTAKGVEYSQHGS